MKLMVGEFNGNDPKQRLEYESDIVRALIAIYANCPQ
jgi:hypothetical protein